LVSVPPEVVVFATAEDFRSWLEAHHADTSELWVGFYKKGTGRPSITWSEAVDQALCFGWIDGVRRDIDDQTYANRFTPRQARSTWSAINIERVRKLGEAGLMHPSGIEAFSRRADVNSAIYSHEQRHNPTLDDNFAADFRANSEAWSYFESQPPSYRKAAIWWVISAKKDETRRRRLATLIADSAECRHIPPLRSKGSTS
jgi:uncharacterized protein YdeI (YjbR/CyaY-like superfamily)